MSVHRATGAVGGAAAGGAIAAAAASQRARLDMPEVRAALEANRAKIALMAAGAQPGGAAAPLPGAALPAAGLSLDSLAGFHNPVFGEVRSQAACGCFCAVAARLDQMAAAVFA